MSFDGASFLEEHFDKVEAIKESSLYECFIIDRPRQEVIDSVVEAYFKFGDLITFYSALAEYFDKFKSGSRIAKMIINSVFVEICEIDGVTKLLNEIIQHPTDLVGIPSLKTPDIARLAREGRNLLRQRRGSLIPESDLRVFTEVAPTFYISAILNDDLDAIDHLNNVPGMRSSFDVDEIRKECRLIKDWSNKYPEHTHRYFLSLKINKVYDRYRKETPLADYFDNVDNGIKERKGVDNFFDESLSLRFGPSMIGLLLEKHSKAASDGQLKVRDMFLALHIKAGVDAYPAYLEARYGRVKAMDFLDDPRDAEEIIDWCMGSRLRERSQDHSFFLAMLAPEELLKHERGQECLQRVHELTRDAKLLPLITSLQYRGKAFGEDLSL